jgi:hypothetical protein
MHAKDDVPVAAGASELQPDRISRSGEQSLPASASSSLKPCNPLRYYHIPSCFTSFLSRFGGECPGTEKRICTERGDISVTAGTQTLQARQRGATCSTSSIP